MGLRALLWNDAERRPRAGWRVALLVVVTLLVGAGVGVGVATVTDPIGTLTPFLGELAATVVVRVLAMAFVGGTTTLTVLVAGRFIDRRRVADFGFHLDRDWWVDLGFGLALGAALMTLVFLVELAAGWVRITGFARPRDGFWVRLLGLTAIFVLVGFYEELLARGYLLTNAAEGLRGYGERPAVGGAVLCSSAVFGLAHASNPNATLVSSLAITLAGVMLAAGYVLTDDLAIPIGLHTTWNLFQGGVYGFPVSGLGAGVTVVAVDQSGPPFLTGGAFGPEAGLLGVAAIGLGTAAIAGWVRVRTGRLRIHPGVTTPDLLPSNRGESEGAAGDDAPTPETE